MNIQFEHLSISNFLSIGNAEIDLNDAGYVAVTGVNKNPKDAAKSNGAGKSSIWESIVWCLTGETMRGSKDVVNKYGNDGAYVELTFNLDNNSYKILRTKDHSKYKTNFKFWVNDVDKSGKGIRDSEKLFAEYLPDLTGSLVGSVIILGQGMPVKFTSNSPSGRKEVLEKLSKSDFMIEDLKSRINSRKSTLQVELRKLQDLILEKSTVVDTKQKLIISTREQIEALEDRDVYVAQVEQFTNEIQKYSVTLNEINSELENIDDTINITYTQKETIYSQYQKEIENFKQPYIQNQQSLNYEISSLTLSIRELKNEINRVENITDICPTCHQKIQGVVKPDVTRQKEDLAVKENQLLQKQQQLKELESSLQQGVARLQETSNKNTLELDKTLAELKVTKDTKKKKLNEVSSDVSKLKSSLAEAEKSLSIVDTQLQSLTDTITNLQNECTGLYKEIEELKQMQEEKDARISAVSKFDTLVKRDFRGYLLSNVIQYIDTRAKNYASDIFENTDISFKLEGNNISITYQDKEYENLSGGEKQKVDLIVQFSIRDMLSEYMNFNSSILVLDEIFDSLDAVGCERVLNMISRRFQNINSIYIISHHAEELSIPVDNYITVIKESSGISYIK